MDCKKKDEGDRVDDESILDIVVVLQCGGMEKIPAVVLISLGSIEESLVFGVELEDEFLSLFFIVEFQKFLISLSVRPGRRAAIWDHLRNRK